MPFGGSTFLATNLGRQQEDLARGAAIDMHFLVDGAVRRDLDEAGREHGGDCSRSEQHFAEQFDGARMTARSDLAHVPDHRALRIEIGRADEKPPPFHVFGGDLLEELRR